MDQSNLEKLNALLDSDTELKEKIKEQVTEMDKKARNMLGILNRIHSTRPNELPVLLNSVRPILASTSDVSSALAEIVPPNQFWRFKESWSNSLRTCVFVAALIEYLDNQTLITLPLCGERLGIKDEWQGRFVLSAEDYLHGLITLVNELSRLAVNSVTLENFEEPLKISVFVKDIFTGFSMLNLKNDTLRRRFDSLKYDVKKIEEVVYDVSLRKLVPPSSKAT